MRAVWFRGREVTDILLGGWGGVEKLVFILTLKMRHTSFLFIFLVCFFPITFFIKEMPCCIAEASITVPTVDNITNSVSLKTEIYIIKNI